MSSDEDYSPGGLYNVQEGEVLDGRWCKNYLSILYSFYSRYMAKSKLGSGGFSTVWLCLDQEHQREVAVKVARSDAVTRAMGQDEILLLESALECEEDHPGRDTVLQLLGQGEVTGPHGSHLCLVLEPLGADLLQCLEATTGQPRLATVKVIMKQIMEGLDFLHTKAKIIHTDIKPENIMLSTGQAFDLSQPGPPGLKVKIGDFGNACWTTKKFAQAGEPLGTREYVGPEVLVGADYSTPLDVWSAACLAWELATGEYLMLLDPEASNKEEEHLACVTQLLGPLPRELIGRGKYGRKYYTKEGQLKKFTSSKLRPCSLIWRLLKFQWPQQQAEEFSRWLQSLLVLEPEERSTAGEAVKHPFLGHEEQSSEVEEGESLGSDVDDVESLGSNVKVKSIGSAVENLECQDAWRSGTERLRSRSTSRRIAGNRSSRSRRTTGPKSSKEGNKREISSSLDREQLARSKKLKHLDLNIKTAALEAQITKLEGEVDYLKSKNDELVVESKREISIPNVTIAKINKEVAGLKSKLEAKDKVLADKAYKALRERESIDELSTILQKAQQENEQFREEVIVLKKASQLEIGKVRKEIEAKDKDIKDGKMAFENMSKKYQDQIMRLKKELQKCSQGAFTDVNNCSIEYSDATQSKSSVIIKKKPVEKMCGEVMIQSKQHCWGCSQCGKLFASHELVLVHKAKPHTKICLIKLGNSTECSREFVKTADLRRHEYEAHGLTNGVTVCEQCSEVVENKSAAKHNRSQHSLPCGVMKCEAQFINMKVVWSHHVRHHGVEVSRI